MHRIHEHPRPPSPLRRPARLLAVLCLAFCSGGAAGGPSQKAVAPADDRFARRLDLLHPPGRLVDIGSHRLHLFCLGRNAPTVILEAGLGGFSLEWLHVQRNLSRDFRVCSYDRAGYGWSDPGPRPRTVARLVWELKQLLDIAKVPGPYVLVGHSFGGYTVQYFAKRYPADTAGAVLVDSSHPDQFSRFPPDVPGLNLRPGFNTRQLTFPQPPANYPPEVRVLATRLMQLPRAIQTERAEYRSFKASGAEIDAAGPMPAVPMLVLTRGERVWPPGPTGDEMERIWRQLQAELAHSEPRARQEVVAGSGHYIHLDRPRAVEAAVRAVARSAESIVAAPERRAAAKTAVSAGGR